MSPPIHALAALALAALAPRHARWIGEEVHFLVGSSERSRFEELATDEERDRFVELFWLERDPTPSTAVNEFRDALYRRLTEADRLFTEGSLRGRFGERGRIFILLGPPSFRETYSHAGGRLVPTELWHYSKVAHPALPDSFRLVFFRPLGDVRFRLFDPLADGPAALVPDPEPGRFLVSDKMEEIREVDPELAGAVERLVSGAESGTLSLLANLDALSDLARAPLREAVRTSATFRSIEAHLQAVVVEDDAGVAEVHYALELVSSDGLFWERDGRGGHRARFALVGRLIGPDGEIERWEDALAVEVEGTPLSAPLSFQGRRPLPQGATGLHVALVNEGGGIAERSASFDRLLVARSIRGHAELPPRLPFVVGSEALSPIPGPMVSGGVLAALLVGAHERGDVVFELWRKGERLFRERQEPMGTVALLRLPLDRFAPGSFRLRVVHAAGVSVRDFEWRPDAHLPLPRLLVRADLPAEAARYRELRAASFSRRGERRRAIEELKLAVSALPGSVRLQLELAALSYAAGRHQDVVDQLEPLAALFTEESDLFVLLAASSEALGRFERSVELYEKALELSPENAEIRQALDRARLRRDR